MKTNIKIFVITLCSVMLCTISCNNDNRNDNMRDRDDQSYLGEKKTDSKDAIAQLSTPAVKLKTDMRRLWMDHITYTRDVVLHVIDGLPGTEATVDRLMQNQEDIGDAIKPYYGKAAGDRLTALLKTHINQAAALLKAAKANDKEEFNRVDDMWKQNADSISRFLSGANSYWDYNEVKRMMNKHLELTTDEAVDRQKKDYEADVKNFDKVRDEILEMADALTEGIIKQFPDKFEKGEEKVAVE